MTGMTIGFGALLLLLGPAGYFASGGASPTAFIPSAFGGILLICGKLSAKPTLRMHAMHAAVVVALLGAVSAGIKVIPGISTLFHPEDDKLPIKEISQLAMALLCTVYVVMAVRSFIAASQRRRENPGQGS